MKRQLTPIFLFFSISLFGKNDGTGSTIPDLKVQLLDGKKTSIHAFLEDGPLLIDFWATWCGPCVRELPNVKKAYAELHEQGFEIIGISLDNSEQKLTDFVAKNDMPWAQFCDGKGWKEPFASWYEVEVNDATEFATFLRACGGFEIC